MRLLLIALTLSLLAGCVVVPAAPYAYAPAPPAVVYGYRIYPYSYPVYPYRYWHGR